MVPVHSILIENFRGISHLKYHPSQINLITGPNNSGKSSLLDAISIFYLKEIRKDEFENDPFVDRPSYNVRLGSEQALISINSAKVFLFKSLDTVAEDNPELEQTILEQILAKQRENYINRKFSKEQVSKYIQIILEEFSFFVINWDTGFTAYPFSKVTGFYEIGESKKLETFIGEIVKKGSLEQDLANLTLIPRIVRTEDKVLFPVVQIGHDDKRNLSQIDEKDLILLEQIIRENELIPSFERLSQDKITCQHGNDLISLPISAYGDGFITILETIHQLLKAKGGILLIEEPENHLHPRYIQVFADTVMKYSKKLDVQVFMSTHSYDLIDVFLKIEEKPDQMEMVSVLRLAKDDDNLISMQYDAPEALRVTQDLLLDLRGV